MSVYNACYCTREEAQRALDLKPTAIDALRVDRAIEDAREVIDALTHRRFYNIIETHYFDWPNYQYAYPWRIWFDAAELADVTVNVPVVTSGSTVLNNANLFWGNPTYPTAPFTYIEINRSTNTAFGVSSTPQRDVAITGTFGYWNKQASAGSLAATISSTSATTCTVTNGSSPGVGDVMIVDSESMLVQDKNWFDTTYTQFSGVSTALNSDVTLTPSGGTFYAGETLLLDSEEMLITAVSGSTVTVKRAWNGSVLATHTSSEIYANRSLTITRGFGGTTAATHSNAAPVNIALVPPAIKTLAIAEATNIILQETSCYAHMVGETGASMTITGGQLDDLRDQLYQKYGRKSRRRVI